MSVTHFNLQPWEEGLKGVDPGVHDLTAAHVHINVERRVTLSFIAQLSPEKCRQRDFYSVAYGCVWNEDRALCTNKWWLKRINVVCGHISDILWQYPVSWNTGHHQQFHFLLLRLPSEYDCKQIMSQVWSSLMPTTLYFDLSPPKFHFSHTVALFRCGTHPLLMWFWMLS